MVIILFKDYTHIKYRYLNTYFNNHCLGDNLIVYVNCKKTQLRINGGNQYTPFLINSFLDWTGNGYNKSE